MLLGDLSTSSDGGGDGSMLRKVAIAPYGISAILAVALAFVFLAAKSHMPWKVTCARLAWTAIEGGERCEFA